MTINEMRHFVESTIRNSISESQGPPRPYSKEEIQRQKDVARGRVKDEVPRDTRTGIPVVDKRKPRPKPPSRPSPWRRPANTMHTEGKKSEKKKSDRKRKGVRKLTPREQARADSYEDEGGAVDPDTYGNKRESREHSPSRPRGLGKKRPPLRDKLGLPPKPKPKPDPTQKKPDPFRSGGSRVPMKESREHFASTVRKNLFEQKIREELELRELSTILFECESPKEIRDILLEVKASTIGKQMGRANV